MVSEVKYSDGLRATYTIEVNMLNTNNSKSDAKIITHGVSQGSILGPLLVIIYMNDFLGRLICSSLSYLLVSRSSDLLFTILFAGDISVFIEVKKFTNITNLEYRIRKSEYMVKSNKLTVIITKKTNYMMFHRTRIKLNANFKILIKQ